MKNTGHQYIIDFFQNALEKEKLSHAYCLVGPKDVGKESVARRISSEILEVDQDKLHKCPDFKMVEKQDGKRNISVDQIRGSKKYVSQHPYVQDKKVLFLKNSDNLSNSAANAFLKTLEEPAEGTIILMTALDEKKLLNTIESRAQILYVRPVSRKKIEEKLKNEDVNKDLAKEIARASMGLQDRAIRWSRDVGEYENFKQEIKRFRNMFSKPFYEKVNLIKDLHEKNKSRGELSDVLSTWELGARDLVFSKFDLDKSSCCNLKVDGLVDISTKNLLQTINEIQTAKQNLKQNLNKKLLLEKVLLTIP